VHSNGFSLVRRLAEDKGWKMDRPALFDQDKLLIDHLMEPTRIYVSSLLPLIRDGLIDALAHITGGGLLENIPRALPGGARAKVHASRWPLPRLMSFLQAQGHIEPAELARTFNCGIGMVLMVTQENAEAVTNRLQEAGETVFPIGEVVEGTRGCDVDGTAGLWSAQSDWVAEHDH